jgi:glutathione synthase
MLPTKMPPPSLLWITDPWSTLDVKKDTTLRLAHEAKIQGIASWWSSPDLLLGAKKKLLRAIPIEHAPNADFAVDLDPSKIFQIHFRIDPPVDDSYRKLIADIVERGVEPERILNPPGIIGTQSEKLPPPELLDLSPAHHAIHSKGDMELAYPDVRKWKSFVTKPMNLAQSVGVKKWPTPGSLPQFLAIMEEESERFGLPLLVEEFLPGITAGETRLWFAMGHLIGALKKHPLPGDFRVLIDSGSRIEAHEPGPTEKEVARRIGLALKRQKVALAAVDLIDGRICDYNITSPGLLVQLEEVHQENLARVVIEKLIAGF